MDKIEFLKLGKQPIANRFLDQNDISNEFFYDLNVGLDKDTGLVTQMDYVDAPLMFNKEYAYRGSMSKTMVNHFASFSLSVAEILPANAKILEIGSNDGVFLKNWNSENAIAVEPCGNFAKETNELGYKTYNEFWTKELSERIVEEHGKMDFIFAANCICHIPNLDETFSAVRETLNDDGIFVFEDPSLARMLVLNSYDQIYDEHPHIFSVSALQNILARNDLNIVKVDELTVHGGSNRIWVKKSTNAHIDPSVEYNLDLEKSINILDLSTMKSFADRVQKSKEDLLYILNMFKQQGKKVISYGATSKSTTVFNYCAINTDLIDYITDTTPEKQNKVSPGMHIPIISPEDGFNNSVDYAYLGAWNFAEEIKKKESSFTGKFITHVPTVRLL